MMNSLKRPLAIGFLEGGGLAAFYLIVVSLAQGSDAALAQLRVDAPLLLPIFPLFGAQVGLLAYLRARAARRMKGMNAGTAASGGLSSTAVVACCAHLLPTFLPIVGATAFASVFSAMRGPLLVLAVLANLVGLAWMGHALVRGPGRPRSAPVPPVQTSASPEIAVNRDPAANEGPQEGQAPSVTLLSPAPAGGRPP